MPTNRLHQIIRTLALVTDRYAPSRILSFGLAHVFKTMQLMENNGRISRALLMEGLGLREGSIKTLVKHMKMNGLIDNSNAGMWLTNKGKTMFTKLQSAIPAEMDVPKCSIAIGRFNHAILVKGLADNIRSGIEQRDVAIKIGAVGATTLIFRDGRFMMPERNQNPLKKDPQVRVSMIKNLKPDDSDVVIIGSATDRRTAEMAAKSVALQTIADHERHI
mgnify:CR=1 FL=1